MKKTFRRTLAMLCALVLGVGMAALPVAPTKPLAANAASKDVVKIACIGASTVFGAESGDGTSWPLDLQQLIGGLCEVGNFGENSRTVTKGGVDVQWDNKTNQWVATNDKRAYTLCPKYQASLDFKPDYTLIMLGVNDSKPVNWKDGNNTFDEDYRALVKAYQDIGSEVIVVIEPWVKGESWSITEAGAVKVRAAYTKIAEEMGLRTIDLFTPSKGQSAWYADGVHPNSKGYMELAKSVAAQLKEMGDIIPEGSEDTPIPFRPDTSVGNFYGEFDGYEVMQWVNGTTGGFAFASGRIADEMGIKRGTVVKNLTIDLSYYWEGNGSGNNWWHFNTTDKTGQSAPAKADPVGSPHDNGYGQFTAYGMTTNAWNILSESRDEQMLGGSGNDWNVNVGGLGATNSLYIRGYKITATLEDGTVKTLNWGTMKSRRTAADGKQLRVACVGASTTRGNNWSSGVLVDNGTSYPGFLQEMLGKSAIIGNFGLPGGSATKRTDGFNNLIYYGNKDHQDSLKFNPDVVIIDLGVNDSQPGLVAMKTFEKDYEEIVQSYLDLPSKPLILISFGGYCTGIDPWGTSSTNIDKLIQPAQLRVAAKFDLDTADLGTLLKSDPKTYLCDVDGVHYTEAGNKAVAELYYNALLPLIELPADKTALNKAIDEAIEDLTGYTDETAKAYTTALNAAKALQKKDGVKQADVDAAVEALKAATEALAKKPVDKTALDAALKGAVTDFVGYTEKAVNAYIAAVDAALLVQANADATQADVDAAVEALETAAAALIRWGDANRDKEVSTSDARAILQYCAELKTADELDMVAANVSGDDEEVTTSDARLILQYCAELITEFPAETN